MTNTRKVPACGKAVNDGLHTAPRRPGPPVRLRPGAGLGSNFTPGIVRIPTNRRSFLVYQNGPADITMAGNRIVKICTFRYWLVSDGYVSSGTTRRNRGRAIRVDLRGRHHHDEDHDPVAGLRHPRQRRPD